MFLLLCFSSCDKAKELEEHAVPFEPASHHKVGKVTTQEVAQSVVLGTKLNNPYSVTNMNIALQELEKNYPSLIPDFTLPTTHYYAKFFVQSSEDLENLQKQKLELFPYPLDYEMDLETDYTLATKEELTGKWVYTSVPTTYDFKQNQIEYEILEDLFLEDVSNTTIQYNNQSYSFYDILDETSTTISMMPPGNNPPPPIDIDVILAEKKRPKGFVRVWDTERGMLVPVEGVRVRTRRWFKYGYDYTDENGFYEVDETYRRDVHYTVIFRNESGFVIWSSIIAMQRAEHNVGQHDRAGYDIDIQQNSRAWRFATVNDATVKYRRYCGILNVGIPDPNLRILATDGDGSSSTPMLTKTWGLIGFSTNSELATFLLKANGISIGLNFVSIFLRFVSPDVIIEANSSQGTAEVYNSTFHELGHASHFEKVGSSYWTKYINYIITYGSYGDGTGNNVGICALGEAWANHMGHQLTLLEFRNIGATTDNSIITFAGFENFTPVSRPGRDIVGFTNRNDVITSWEGWIPGGIMWDLMDANTDNIRAGFIDNAEGYSNQEIYDALDWGIESLPEFRDRLLRESNDRDRTDVINLFEAYFWN